MVNEPKETMTFRVGLFGLDKWKNVSACVSLFEKGLEGALTEASAPSNM